MKDVISIAIHTGSIKYIFFLQNLIKSIIVCNPFKRIELILIETGGVKEIRDWMNKIDFKKNFINFDGTLTDIKVAKNYKINKKLLFLNFPKKTPWFYCYMKGVKKASEIAKGTFFLCFSEDYQFFLKGNSLLEYIKTIKSLGRKNTILSPYYFTKYRISKQNNKIDLNSKFIGRMKFKKFKEKKGDIFGFMSNKISKNIKNFPNSTIKDPHATINKFNKFVNKKKINRYYPFVSPCIHFANKDREFLSNLIKRKTKINKNYLLYKVLDYKDFLRLINRNHLKYPISIEDLIFLRDTNFIEFISYYTNKLLKKFV